MLTNPTLTNKVRYTLIHAILGRKEVTESLNFRDDFRSWKRTERHGFTNSFSSTGEFIGLGAEFIDQILNSFGANTVLRIERDDRNPNTDIWENTYSAELDLINASKEGNTIKVKTKKGGLERYLSANEGAKVELSRVTDLKDNSIDAINTSQILLESRRVFLISNYDTPDDYSNYTQEIKYITGNKQWESPVPFDLISTGVPYTQQPIQSEESDNNTTGRGSVTYCFIYDADEDKELSIDTVINGSVNAKYLFYSTAHFLIRLVRYTDGDTLNVAEEEDLYSQVFTRFNTEDFYYYNGNQIVTSKNDNTTFNFSININRVLDVKEGESYALLVEVFPFERGGLFGQGSDYYAITYDEGNYLQVTEDSFYDDTSSKVVTLNNAMNQVTKIVTNGGAFKSEYLENGFAKDMLLAHGFWIRKFDAFDDVFKPIELSFKSLDESIDSVFNTGITVERINNVDTVVLEDLDYFYSDHTAVRLTTKVSNVKRYPAKDMYYSGIQVGYKEGGDYDESVGLNEYNTSSNYSTENDAEENVYDKISDLRADSYGVEFARRKQKNLFPTEDTSYDDKIFLLSGKANPSNTSRYLLKKYQDVLTALPTGVFSPETAYNYELTPFNNLKRHSKWFASGLSFTNNAKLSYISGESAISLKTSLGNERVDTSLDETGYSKFYPEIVEFDYGVDYELIKQLESAININGRDTLNIYGRILFETDKGMESGWILEFDPKGKFKVLKSK